MAKLRLTYGETPINVQRNSNQHRVRLLPRYSKTPNNIRSNSGQHPSKLRTPSVPTPDNIRPNSGQHPFQLPRRDDQTEQPQTFSSLKLSRDEGLPFTFSIFVVLMFPSTNGNCVPSRKTRSFSLSLLDRLQSALDKHGFFLNPSENSS